MPVLEDRLTLVAWFAQSLGYENNAVMLHKLKDAKDGWGNVYNHTLERLQTEERGISPATWQMLYELDREIRTDWEAINRNRLTPLSLKYFQYLACLSSAMFLRRLAESPEQLLQELRAVASSSRRLESYNDIEDINKLAFWMATGSGKTLLMHIHIRQFIRHRHALFAPDNILLITPNEELSHQHIAEMQQSNIPCFRHGESDTMLRMKNAVRVIEITKFTDENGGRRRSRGESVAAGAFAGRNLVLVDEGHRGAGGQEWFKRRDALTKNGFVFEYSATFGQALNAADKDERTKEYARAILFDYSYRFFYDDGYGKDFSILNIDDNNASRQADAGMRDLVMLGNLLAFFQQQQAFENRTEDWQAYMVEKPLLLLLGATVGSAGTTDMTEIIAFLHRVIADKNASGRAWLAAAAKKILNGGAGFLDTVRARKRYEYLIRKFAARRDGYNKLCAALRKQLFYAEAPGALQVRALKQTKGDSGEIVLKAGDNNPPFGLVYVGSPKKLVDLLKNQAGGMEIGEDAIQKPLFGEVHTPQSPINILIGAKKFMEGWSSWRVCGMGLLNVGRSEGAQIIQLFGRGVRLKGKDFSLKRSAALPRENGNGAPEYLHLLETLNIFAVRANFMAEFRNYLRNEGVSEEKFLLKIKTNPIAQGKGLKRLDIPPAGRFTALVDFTVQKNIAISLDMSIATQAIEAGDNDRGIAGGDIADESAIFNEEVRSRLDFNALYRRLLEHKRTTGRTNLLIKRDELPKILAQCAVRGRNVFAAARSYADIRRLHEIAFSALCKYADRLYYRRQRQWETEHMGYMPLFDGNRYVHEENHTIAIASKPKNDQIVQDIQDLLKMKVRPYLTDIECSFLPRLGGRPVSTASKGIIYDEHIYIPLLLDKHHEDITLSPPGLTKSEKKFVVHLQQYVLNNPITDGRELFLLRNGSKGKGIGFNEDEGFYPDFILWIKQGGKQRLVFVEPHGMLHAKSYMHDFKAQLWKRLQTLSKKLQRKEKGAKNVSLDAYIISETPYAQLKTRYHSGDWSKEKFANHHILFAEDGASAIKEILG